MGVHWRDASSAQELVPFLLSGVGTPACPMSSALGYLRAKLT